VTASVDDLKRIPLFAGLEPDAIAWVAAVTLEVEVRAGQALMQPGATGSGMFFILEGTAEVEAREARRELGPGDFFGELALLTDKGRRTARVRAKSDMRCLALDRAGFDQLEHEHPEVAASLLETSLRRIDTNA
jgi:CRP-like cAMP-binding protein